MKKTKQFIISLNRSDNVITAKWNKLATIVVREDQEKDYKKHNDNKILAIPMEEDGNCAKKKNAVLNRFVDENVLILDDDITAVGYHEKGRVKKVSDEYLQEFCDNMFQMTEDLNTVLWGVNMQSDKKFYREYSPFSFNSAVLGPFTAIRNIDRSIRFNEKDIFLKEDYDLSLQVLNKYRRLLRNNKWFYISEHIELEGGLSGLRSQKIEMEHNIRLQKKWGSRIVKINRKTQNQNKTINPIVKVPIKGI